MDEKTQRAFSRFFCSYGNYAYLLNKIISGEPLTEIWGDYYEMSLEKWLQEKNIPKEDVINWLQKSETVPIFLKIGQRLKIIREVPTTK